MLMCVGCAKEGSNENINTEPEQGRTNTEISTGIESEDTENMENAIPSDGIVYSELSRDTLVSDEEMTGKVLQLLLDEKSLLDTLDSECEVDLEDSYEVDGSSYYRVAEVDHWDYYEDIAGNYYSDEYLERFTAEYEKLFVEANDKLYRAMADGVAVTFYEDSIEIWQAEEGTYYVTIKVNSVGGGDFYNGYIIQMSENDLYGYEIADKVIVH